MRRGEKENGGEVKERSWECGHGIGATALKETPGGSQVPRPSGGLDAQPQLRERSAGNNPPL